MPKAKQAEGQLSTLMYSDFSCPESMVQGIYNKNYYHIVLDRRSCCYYYIAQDKNANDALWRNNMKSLYEAKATATGGRMGHVKTSDGIIDMKMSLPKSLGGPTDDLANPEQLFAAGYSACFGSALDFVAGEKKVTLKDHRVDATVGIGKNDAGGFALKVKLDAALPGVEREVAQDLLDTAHKVCPYSNAVRGNVEVDLNLVD